MAQHQGWDAEQTQDAYQRFNFWAPFPHVNCPVAKVLNSLWSTFTTLIMIYGPKLPGLFKSFKSWVGKKLAGTAADAAGDAVGTTAGAVGTTSSSTSTAGTTASSLKGTLKSIKHRVLTQGFRSLKPEHINFLKKFFPRHLYYFSQNTYRYANMLYTGVWAVKQFCGGFISPTEWVELAFGVGFGFKIQSCPKLSFALNFVWNWWDNFLFIGLEDQTTMGLFTWLGYISQGECAFTGRGTTSDTSLPY